MDGTSGTPSGESGPKQVGYISEEGLAKLEMMILNGWPDPVERLMQWSIWKVEKIKKHTWKVTRFDKAVTK